MGTVLPFRRRVASRAVIVKLIELGYLRPAKRFNEGVVEHAVERLKWTLQQDGVICDLSRRCASSRKGVQCRSRIDAAPKLRIVSIFELGHPSATENTS